MPNFKDTVSFDDVYAIRETDRALLCSIEGEEVWVPQSQIDDLSEVWEEGQEGTLVINLWFAEQKNLT